MLEEIFTYVCTYIYLEVQSRYQDSVSTRLFPYFLLGLVIDIRYFVENPPT